VEGGARPGHALDPDAAAVQLDDGPRDGQPQATALPALGRLALRAIEPLEDVGLVRERDPRPVVADREQRLVAAPLRPPSWPYCCALPSKFSSARSRRSGSTFASMGAAGSASSTRCARVCANGSIAA